ncbi:MAG: MBL fold metallo-hydrolase [Deltaproteobacteria bacterium]|nr:MBL fold metallo-hydrolase [Deltaproteobacteria bacterium]
MAPVTPRIAASVVLLRRNANDDIEILWVRRAPTLRVLGGFHTYPGGTANADDGPAGSDEAIRHAAVRELAEEVSVTVDPATLIPAGRWVTPEFSPFRYDTHFFLAWANDAQVTAVRLCEGGELDACEWIRPADAIARWERGDVLLAPPTLHVLQSLAPGWTGAVERLYATPEAGGAPAGRIEMRKGVLLLPLCAPTLPPFTHTNCFIVGGADIVVVDPGSPYDEEQTKLHTFVEALLREGRTLRAVLLTHYHGDHVGGAAAFRARFGTRVFAHAETAKRLDAGVVDDVIPDAHTFALDGAGGFRLRSLFTPGHAPGHFTFLEETTGTLLAGDLLAGVGTVIVPPPPDGDMGEYIASLKRVRDVAASVIFPAHGPIITNPRGHIDQVIRHRELREAQILAAIGDGAWSLDDLTSAVYTDVPATMHRFAKVSLKAHLMKLERDGRATHDGEVWRRAPIALPG